MMKTRRKFVTLLGLVVGLAWMPTPVRAKAVTPVTTPWIRVNDGLSHMRVDPKGRFISWVDKDGMNLRVVDTRSQNIFDVSPQQVGASTFWSPDGFRLFFRELVHEPGTSALAMQSRLKAFDAALGRVVDVDSLPARTGILTFDPRDLRMHLLSNLGIRTKRIYFPDERMARWQVAHRTEEGKWLATQQGMLWVTQAGFALTRLEDDGSALESFDISPDGSACAWATAKGKIWISANGQTPKFIDYGRDPRWHPNRPLLVFAGSRMVGDVAISYDIKVSDTKGSGRFLTRTQFSNERWPNWHPKGQQIIYTIANTTDIFLLDFQ